mmetsp:Transcript_48725/g.146825  ORF Transcript_48725/g.146825 Transcript_48725/m.146825 type:complete len:339 (-) Transcript_48725:474-1490(-)
MAPFPYGLCSTAMAAAATALTLLVASPSSDALLPTRTLPLRPKYALHRRTAARPTASLSSSSSSTSLRMNFLGDMFKDAFSNDSNLSSDKSSGQLEGPGVEESSYSAELTDVQRNFLASEQARRSRSTSTAGGKFGAPVDPAKLANTKWTLGFYLAGIPDRDPSNDLYGQKINISNRDRSMGLGMAEVSEEPTCVAEVTLGEDGSCRASTSEFTSGEVDGEWKLSDDGRYLRLSVDCLGYRRMIQTKGTIQKVFWSDADEISTKTSSIYSIPPGVVYCDIPVGYGLPGQLVMKGQGSLRVEQTSGLMGISSKMVQCGKFEGRMAEVDSSNKGGEKGAL